MTKGNDLDVGNTDFELQTKRAYKFLCFTLFGNFRELLIISANRCLIEMGFGSKCNILNGQVGYI